MSRTPASYSMPVVRGSTWEDEFTYTDEDGIAIDLTGYSARMQVRTLAGQYGTSTTDSLMLELTTDNGLLAFATAVEGRLVIKVPPETHAVLNPSNAKKAKYAYSVELFIPTDGTNPEYVIPLVQGKVSVAGEVTR